jgi:DNA-binding HxlR family transcriptional regulator
MNMDRCPVRTTMDVIDGKWKPLIVYYLKTGKQRFGQLRRNISEAPRKVLTEQLREMERDGLVERRARQRPLEVEYSLTDYGETLVPILALMAEWGERHKIKQNENSQPANKQSRRGSNQQIVA